MWQEYWPNLPIKVEANDLRLRGFVDITERNDGAASFGLGNIVIWIGSEMPGPRYELGHLDDLGAGIDMETFGSDDWSEFLKMLDSTADRRCLVGREAMVNDPDLLLSRESIERVALLGYRDGSWHEIQHSCTRETARGLGCDEDDLDYVFAWLT